MQFIPSTQYIKLKRDEMYLFEYLKMTAYFEEESAKKDPKNAGMFGYNNMNI